MPDQYADKIIIALITVITQYRNGLNITLEDLADQAGIHRTTLGLWERNERTPTIDNAVRLAKAMGVELSVLLQKAEAIVAGSAPDKVKKRSVNAAHFHNQEALTAKTKLTLEGLIKAFEGCYETLDTIDNELAAQGSEPISRLVELANLSSMIGNLAGAQIAKNSGGI